MRNAIRFIIGYYSDSDFPGESYFQATYIQFLLAGVFVFWSFFPNLAILPTIFFSIHLLLLYTIGYKKMMWEGDKKEKIYQNIFIGGQILLILAALVIDWKLTLICLGIPIGVLILGFFLMFIAAKITYKCENEDKIESIAHKFSILYFCIPAITFIVTLFLLPIHVIAQIGILLAMIFILPYICLLDDEGVNILQVTFDTTFS